MNLAPKRSPFSFDPTDDHATVLAARSGDQEAFAILVKRHTPKIFAVALSYARVREDAEDIVQETFQNAFLYLDKFEGKSTFLTWLTRIAINQALMLLRTRRSRRESPMDTSDSEGIAASLLDMADPRPDPEENYVLRERVDVLSAAIGTLRPTVRTAIELRGLADLSIRETARQMGISVGAVKARIFQGRKRLRNTLGPFQNALQGEAPTFGNLKAA
jgi:RNA polymerase sigma-70 factor (ECF subfamily)